MKTVLAGILATVAGGFAFAAPQPPASKPTTQPSKPVNKYCAVMQKHEADPKVTYAHKGKVYAFCCEGCIDTFKESPDKFKDAK